MLTTIGSIVVGWTVGSVAADVMEAVVVKPIKKKLNKKAES